MGNQIDIRYEFRFEDGRQMEFAVSLDPEHLNIQTAPDESTLPEWTKLQVEQCDVCPLKVEQSPRCPVSVQLADLIEKFKDEVSYTKVHVRVITHERIYEKYTSMQEALFSIFGLVMATSGCPIMSYLKPLARFHLPFASVEESMVRSVAMHLLRQYFEQCKGNQPDFDLKALDKKYGEIQKVNIGISKRLGRVIRNADATHNTVTAFHSISQMLSLSVHKKMSRYEYLFQEES